jgi:hypothetical protein
MDNFINTRILSTTQLETFMSCCDARAQKEGYTSWSDPNLVSPLKKSIILNCIETCAFPVAMREDSK